MKFDTAFWEHYKEYLKSEKWMMKRYKVLVRDGGMCQGCLEVKAVQVHHKSYDRVFDEPLFDLVSLCMNCHEKIHDKTTWEERSEVFRTRKTITFNGEVGIVTQYLDHDIIEAEFRDGSKAKLMIWEVTFNE